VQAVLAPARIAALAALALALGSCGGGDDAGAQRERAPARSGPPGVTLIGGEKLQSARCRQWRGASEAEKAAVVQTLKAVVGGPTPYGPASTLPAPYAHALFDRTCARFYARGFLLYELYTRAAAFYATPRRDL
jgi:hypothetical protein